MISTGGTIDITVHEVQEDGSLKEVHMANGGEWGGTKVDEAFSNFLEDALSRETYKRFCDESRADEMDMFRDFEVKKRAVKFNETNKVTMKIPSALNESCRKILGRNIKSHFASGRWNNKVAMFSDKCRFTSDVIQDFFNEPVKRIVDQLRTVTRSIGGVSAILMVGGFSESDILQCRVKETFPNIKVIIPHEAGLIVLKGAVIYGHEPSIISSRICRYTYGIDVCSDFIPGRHDEANKITRKDGRVKCLQLFSRHVVIGQSVAVGVPQTSQRYSPDEADTTSEEIVIYASSKENPMYITDYGCLKIGSVTIPLPDTSKGLNRCIEVKMTFSSTELEVTATNVDTGETVDVSCDCL